MAEIVRDDDLLVVYLSPPEQAAMGLPVVLVPWFAVQSGAVVEDMMQAVRDFKDPSPSTRMSELLAAGTFLSGHKVVLAIVYCTTQRGICITFQGIFYDALMIGLPDLEATLARLGFSSTNSRLTGWRLLVLVQVIFAGVLSETARNGRCR